MVGSQKSDLVENGAAERESENIVRKTPKSEKSGDADGIKSGCS